MIPTNVIKIKHNVCKTRAVGINVTKFCFEDTFTNVSTNLEFHKDKQQGENAAHRATRETPISEDEMRKGTSQTTEQKNVYKRAFRIQGLKPSRLQHIERPRNVARWTSFPIC
jgi:hypothetical protein